MLADRTNPKRIAERRLDSMRDRARSLRYRVMGMSSDARETASDVADTVREAPQMVARQTQGSPLAAGLVAFGAGLLAAALLPETDAERRMGEQISEQAGPMLEPVKAAAADVAADVKESAQAAATEVTESVKQGAARTAEQAHM
jgi:hypothetical protein